MAALRAAWRVWFVLFVCLLGLSATHPLTAAESAGMLAVVQPASDENPAILKLYSPEAQLVHALELPASVAVSDSALSPDGLHLATLRGEVSLPEEDLRDDLTLNILRTTDLEVVRSIPLLPANFPNNIAINAGLVLERDPTLDDYDYFDFEESLWLVFASSLGIFEWSPDGKQLAFSAAIDGPSTDLYLYDVEQESVTRLTDGIEQIYGLSWSPDGKWIWHTTISYGYCQACGGHNYAAAADGSTVVTLPGDDVYLFRGWVDGDSYLVTDQANGPGAFDLQLVDVPTGKSQSLWPGVHRRYIYDPDANRLGLLGTVGRTYDPNEQVFVVNLATGDTVEYDELETALEVEPWLAPLNEIPSTIPCARPGLLIYPCLDTPFDPLSPDGAYLVGEEQEVVETNSGTEVLPPLPDVANGGVLWRPDSAGYYISQTGKLTYRDLATGETTEIEGGTLLGWLPHAVAGDFSAAAPSSPAATPSPTATATPIATPEIVLPARHSILAGSVPATAYNLRVAQARELALLAQGMLDDPSAQGAAWRNSGLPLLLVREAVRTTSYPYYNLLPVPYVEPEAADALDAALAVALPSLATFPAGGSLPTLNSLALNADGTLIATGHSDGTVRLWDVEAGTLMRFWPSSTYTIKHLHFSSDGSMLAAGDQNGSVQIWLVDSGFRSHTHIGRFNNTHAIAWRPGTDELAVANGADPVMVNEAGSATHRLVDVAAEALAYSPDGTKLAVALQPAYPPTSAVASRTPYTPQERPIWIVDADSGERLQELPDDRTTDFMAYTPDGNTLVTGSGYWLRGWDLASGTLRFESSLADFPTGWAITPDGEQIAILSRQLGISFFELSSGANIRDLAVDASDLVQLAIHPTERMLISGDFNGRPLLLDEETGTASFPFGPPRARLVAMSPASSMFATADTRTITLHDLESQHAVHQLTDAENYLTDLAFSPDGKWLAAREETGYLLLWALEPVQLQWRMAVNDERGGRVAFAPDGRLVIGGSDGVLALVDPADGTLLDQVQVVRGDQILALAVSSQNEVAVIVGAPNTRAFYFPLDDLDSATRQELQGPASVRGQLTYSPDGTLLALVRGQRGSLETTLELWQTADHTLVQSIPLGNFYGSSSLAFSPDGSRIATGSVDEQPIMLWDVETGNALQTLGETGSPIDSTRLVFTPDGTQLLASHEDGTTALYSLTALPSLRTLAGHAGPITAMDLSPNGDFVLTAGEDGWMRLWDWQTGAQLERFAHPSERVASLQHSPRGDAILVAGDRGEVRLYAPWGELQTTLQGNGSPITQALFRPDGAAIATGSEDGSIRSWNRASGIEEWAVEDLPYGVGALAYTPYSSLLAGSAGEGPDSTIYLWDADSGEEVGQLSGHEDKVVDLAFSFDGTLLASASWDQTVRLWDVTSGEEIATLRGHTGRLTDLAFIPNGALVASIAEDHTLRLWDGPSGAAIRELELPHTTPLAVAFSRDGRALLTTHDDGTIRTWLVDPEDTSTESKLLRAAAGVPRVTAEFTAAERRAYAIDTFVGAYALSASGNINIRPERLVQSLIVQPGSPDRVVALTNERFLLTSTDQGESWHIVTRLPLTLTYHSLGIPARVDDPLLVATDKGLYGIGDDGSISLVHRDALFGVSYSHTNPNELWAVRHDGIYKSEDAGATWGPAGNNLSTYLLHAPVLMASPNNNPQLVVGQPADHPARILWRGAANGFWEPLANVPALPLYLTDEQGIAWDAGNRILYLGGEWGELLAVENVDAPAAGDVTATAVEHFGPGTRIIPLAVGEGPSLYMSLLTPSGPKLLRGTWDGATWLWVELHLPIVALG